MVSMLIFYVLLGMRKIWFGTYACKHITVHILRVVWYMNPLCCAISCQLVFFKRDREFVDGQDTETGNTALHIASRHGHLVSVHHCTAIPSLS